MGVSAADLLLREILLLSPPTDDPVVMIIIVMGISGALMLVCGGLGIAARLRQAKAKKEAEKHKQE